MVKELLAAGLQPSTEMAGSRIVGCIEPASIRVIRSNGRLGLHDCTWHVADAD